MTQTKIFIIMGSTGEYDDRYEWPVKALKTEEAAKQFVIDAERIAGEQFALKYPEGEEANYEFEPKSELDPHISIDYTGTFYSYHEVELLDD